MKLTPTRGLDFASPYQLAPPSNPWIHIRSNMLFHFFSLRSTQKPGGTDEEEEEGNGEQEAEMIAKGVELYKELVAGLQESIMKLWRAEELTKIGQSLAELNVELETKQKEALKVIVQIHVDAMLAIDASRLVVTKLKNVCTSLILILDNLATDEGLKIAIETFLDEAKRLNADVDAAVLRLTTVSLASSKGICFTFPSFTMGFSKKK